MSATTENIIDIANALTQASQIINKLADAVSDLQDRVETIEKILLKQ